MTITLPTATLRFNPLRFSRRLVTAAEMHQLVAEAAYYRAQNRNFATGQELEDWLAAEREISDRVVCVGPLPTE